MKRKCIGFGEHEGKCDNPAGTPWSPLWCERCNDLRMAHLDRQMDQIRRCLRDLERAQP